MNKTIWLLAFVVLACGMGFAIGNASTDQKNSSKYAGMGTAGNITTEGGNVSFVNLESNQSTEKWAGVYGNVSGTLVLSDFSAATHMYSWTWNKTAGGTVCASTGNNFLWSAVTTVAAAAIDAAWSFGTAADNATNTMTESGKVLINTANQTSAAAVTTDTAGATLWQTVAFKNAAGTPAKNDLAFCVNITGSGTAFNGVTADYQLIVPTNQLNQTYETYFFYVELK